MTESWSTSTTPLLLFRNLITSLFMLAQTSISRLAHKHKAIQLIRYVFVSSLLFLLRLVLSLNPASFTNQYSSSSCSSRSRNHKPTNFKGDEDIGDTAIARALWQLLSMITDIPVSSRKYQVVRGLAENIIHENQREGVEALRDVNRKVLCAAFSRTLELLEAAASLEHQGDSSTTAADILGGGLDTSSHCHYHWVVKVVRSVADVVWTSRRVGSRSSAEKLAAELLWLAETMATCGFAQGPLERVASASTLARLSLSAEPRLQASLVKLSALLFKYAKDMGVNEGTADESKKEQQAKMLILWIPLLCVASNGSDVPVLSISEKAELERVLEETIDMLEGKDQEGVLSLWLHHFTYCSSSDWPNLHASYARWCDASRQNFLTHYNS